VCSGTADHWRAVSHYFSWGREAGIQHQCSQHGRRWRRRNRADLPAGHWRRDRANQHGGRAVMRDNHWHASRSERAALQLLDVRQDDTRAATVVAGRFTLTGTCQLSCRAAASCSDCSLPEIEIASRRITVHHEAPDFAASSLDLARLAAAPPLLGAERIWPAGWRQGRGGRRCCRDER